MDFLQRLFDDKRLTSVLLMTWMTMVLAIFSELGIMDSHFMKLGPGVHSKVMGVDLDTWYKWSCIAVFTFLSTAVNAFVGDAIMPWIQNTVQDHKTKFLPYSKVTCIVITQVWTLYCCVMSVFALFVMLSQVDFLLIRICADLLVNFYTSIAFMRGKTVDPERYDAWMKSDFHASEPKPPSHPTPDMAPLPSHVPRHDDPPGHSTESQHQEREPNTVPYSEDEEDHVEDGRGRRKGRSKGTAGKALLVNIRG